MSPDVTAEVGILRGIVAAVLLTMFIALWFWAYSGRRRAAFDAAAHLPLEDETQVKDEMRVGMATGRAPAEADPSRGTPQ
jgi:cytochrome c oxidase cbb3-type subunit IV